MFNFSFTVQCTFASKTKGELPFSILYKLCFQENCGMDIQNSHIEWTKRDGLASCFNYNYLWKDSSVMNTRHVICVKDDARS